MEIKILNINTDDVCEQLEKLGAERVFDDVRTIEYFKRDGEDIEPYLKLTREGEKLKLASKRDGVSEVKLFISREKEAHELLGQLGYQCITRVSAQRISYELGSIDFDIDIFPQSKPFLEIDDYEKYSGGLEVLVSDIGLAEHERGHFSTPDIHQKEGKDYFACYSVSD